MKHTLTIFESHQLKDGTVNYYGEKELETFLGRAVKESDGSYTLENSRAERLASKLSLPWMAQRILRDYIEPSYKGKVRPN